MALQPALGGSAVLQAPLPSQPIPKAKVLHHLHSTTAPKAAKADIIADIDRTLDWRPDHRYSISRARGALPLGANTTSKLEPA